MPDTSFPFASFLNSLASHRVRIMRLTEIRDNLGLSYTDIADGCAVSRSAAWQIVNRRGRKVGLTRSRIASVRAWLVWRFRKAQVRDSGVRGGGMDTTEG